jgi:hypothetical protein
MDDQMTDEPTAAPSNRRPKAARRNALPWSDRSILIVSAIVVLLITPLWLDPATVGEFLGVVPARAHCLAAPSPVASIVPDESASPVAAPISTCNQNGTGGGQ